MQNDNLKHDTPTDANNVLAVRLIREFNEALHRAGNNHYGLTGSLVCDVLKKEFPQYKFDTRIQGWTWFFIKDYWIRFFFGKNYCNSDIITHYEFYEPFHKADS